jgi:uncharacterized protein YbjQ (UPF0145 family)
VPLFHRKTEEEKQQEDTVRREREEARVQQEASLASLEQGGLPLRAQQRLGELRQGGQGFFTTDLSVDEFLLSREAGFEPVSQVMGSSVFHVGWQYMPSGYWSSSQELRVISDAMNRARALALGRLEQEAMLVGADAVIGVHVDRGEYDWAEDLIEFSTVGTAVRLPNGPRTERPGLTNLSGQDFWKLFRSGYWPVGVVAASTVFYVVASWATQMANNSWWGSWANQELQDFTQGLYAARHITMSNIHAQPVARQSEGIVGMRIEQESEEHEVEVGNDNTRTDMIFTFHAMGTAIGELANHPPAPATHAVINLRDSKQTIE